MTKQEDEERCPIRIQLGLLQMLCPFRELCVRNDKDNWEECGY